MPYLGKSPSQGVRARYQFTPNAGTTSLSGADANGSTMTFTDGNYVDVYLNGVMLKAGVDYVTTTANTIGSLAATVASDVVDVIVYDTFSLFGGTLEGNVKVNNGTFNVTGATDLDSTLNVDGAIAGTSATLTTADNTTQLTLVSTDADANTGPQLDLYRNSSSPADDDYIGRVKFIGRNDASQDFTGVDFIGRTIDVSDGTEDASLFINTMTGGTTYNRLNITPTEIVINEESRDLDFRVESDNVTNALFVQGSDGFVGIGTNSPDRIFTIENGGPVVEIDPAGASSHPIYFNYNRSTSAYLTPEYWALGHKFMYNGGTTGLEIESDGTVRVKTGNLVMDGSGKGIHLGGASSANLLNDYEEGSWTPSFKSESDTNLTVGYGTFRHGQYTKIGNRVFCQCQIDVDSLSGEDSDNLIITGLPFTASNYATTANGGGHPVYNSGWDNNPDSGIVLSQQTNFRIQKSNATTNTPCSDLTSSTYTTWIFNYMTA